MTDHTSPPEGSIYVQCFLSPGPVYRWSSGESIRVPFDDCRYGKEHVQHPGDSSQFAFRAPVAGLYQVSATINLQAATDEDHGYPGGPAEVYIVQQGVGAVSTLRTTLPRGQKRIGGVHVGALLALNEGSLAYVSVGNTSPTDSVSFIVFNDSYVWNSLQIARVDGARRAP